MNAERATKWFLGAALVLTVLGRAIRAGAEEGEDAIRTAGWVVSGVGGVLLLAAIVAYVRSRRRDAPEHAPPPDGPAA